MRFLRHCGMAQYQNLKLSCWQECKLSYTVCDISKVASRWWYITTWSIVVIVVILVVKVIEKQKILFDLPVNVVFQKQFVLKSMIVANGLRATVNGV